MNNKKRTMNSLRGKSRIYGYNPLVLAGFLPDKQEQKPMVITRKIKTGRINQDLARKKRKNELVK